MILESPSGETRKLFSSWESFSTIDLLTAHLQPRSPGTHVYLRVGSRADSSLIVILTNTETSRQRASPRSGSGHCRSPGLCLPFPSLEQERARGRGAWMEAQRSCVQSLLAWPVGLGDPTLVASPSAQKEGPEGNKVRRPGVRGRSSAGRPQQQTRVLRELEGSRSRNKARAGCPDPGPARAPPVWPHPQLPRSCRRRRPPSPRTGSLGPGTRVQNGCPLGPMGVSGP